MKKRIIIAILMAFVAVPNAYASSKEDDERKNSKHETRITLQEAVQIAEKHTNAKVIEAEYEHGKFEIELRTKDGLEEEIYMNNKGEIIAMKKDNDDRNDYKNKEKCDREKDKKHDEHNDRD